MKKTPEPREEDKIPPPVATESENDSAGTETTEELVVSLQSDVDRFRDLALRTQADFENYKKRGAREKRRRKAEADECQRSIFQEDASRNDFRLQVRLKRTLRTSDESHRR